MFQYSFCSYSTQFPISINQLFFWFQYSFCSYSTIGTWRNFGERHCFNTASVLIQRNHHHNSFEDSKVSIQLLFLFNSHPRSFVPLFHLFQYSFCSYSTGGIVSAEFYRPEFQYSFCSYSINTTRLTGGLL